MADVLVLTDSAASLPEDTWAQLPIDVVPLTIVVDDVPVADGTISPDDIIRRAHAEPITTAGVSPGAFVERIAQEPADRPIVLATVSAKMSATHSAAVIAAAQFAPGRVRVVDTGTAAGAQGLVVLAAARHAAAGASADEVVAQAVTVASRVHLVASLRSLEHLARSGRVPGVAAWAGTNLGLRAVFEFSGGSVIARRPAFSDAAALARMVERCRRDKPGDAVLHGAVLHAQAAARAHELACLVTKHLEPAELFVTTFTSVMTLHTGPGLVGLAWWWEPSDSSAD